VMGLLFPQVSLSPSVCVCVCLQTCALRISSVRACACVRRRAGGLETRWLTHGRLPCSRNSTERYDKLHFVLHSSPASFFFNFRLLVN
jgi:hypothetical protein